MLLFLVLANLNTCCSPSLVPNSSLILISKSVKVLTSRVQLLLKTILKRLLLFSVMFCMTLVIFHFFVIFMILCGIYCFHIIRPNFS